MNAFIHSFLMSPFMIWLGIHLAWGLVLFMGVAWIVGYFTDAADSDREAQGRQARKRHRQADEAYWNWQWWQLIQDNQERQRHEAQRRDAEHREAERRDGDPPHHHF